MIINNPDTQKLNSGFLVEIIKDENTKNLIVKVEGFQDAWQLYQGDPVLPANLIFESKGSGTFPVNNADGKWNLYTWVSPAGNMLLAERHLSMEGGFNFRDLGGIKTKDGKYMKWGKLFRADELSKLTTGDLEYLSSIPLLTVVDFRDERETLREPDLKPESLRHHYHCPIIPGNLADEMDLSLDELTSDHAVTMMEEMYRLLVTDPDCVQHYKKLFEVIQDQAQVPLLFHCTAGKDRTGMATALIYSALGVDEQAIMEDYLSSNIYLKEKYKNFTSGNSFFKTLLEVNPLFLESAFKEIKNQYGSVERFLEDQLKADISHMKYSYLQ